MVESRISQVIDGAVTDLGFRLVRVLYSGAKGGRSQLQIMAEPVEDREMTVEDCESLSRHVAALLNVEDPISDAYTLEVSSPGIDRPLTRIEDYERFAGELAKLTLRFMLDGRKRFNGRLGGLDDEGKVSSRQASGGSFSALTRLIQAGSTRPRYSPARWRNGNRPDRPDRQGLNQQESR